MNLKYLLSHMLRSGLLVLLTLTMSVVSVYAQERDSLPGNWHLLDYREDGVYGISMEKAYRELLVNKIPDTVIVAVIDTGIDTLHEDLRPVLWRKTLEDGKDEDRNGYVGDKRGWHFLGGKDGKSLTSAPKEFMRQYFRLRDRYQGKKPGDIRKKQHGEYQLWLQVREKFREDSLQSVSNFSLNEASFYWSRLQNMIASDRDIRDILGKQEYKYEDLINLGAPTVEKHGTMKNMLKNDPNQTNRQHIIKYRDYLIQALSPYSYSGYVVKGHRRGEIVRDDYEDFNDRYYGNNNIQVTMFHGAFVAGIIGAVRDNGIGVNGIANAVKLMTIRAVPANGDEYDKDVALAIRYAVDNGAKIINMSFAKDYSPQQKWVEKAIRYAAKKDVLIVNGAGNDGRSIDTVPKYPTSKYMNKGKRFPHMITVGASGPTKEKLVASFSNYGAAMVDVFAPGVDITSTMPDNAKDTKSGTSFASPVVAGVAAVLRSYFPELSAQQVKDIIEASVTMVNWPVVKPGQWHVAKNKKEQVRMNKLCKTSGIVNAYLAIKLAETVSKK